MPGIALFYPIQSAQGTLHHSLDLRIHQTNMQGDPFMLQNSNRCKRTEIQEADPRSFISRKLHREKSTIRGCFGFCILFCLFKGGGS